MYVLFAAITGLILGSFYSVCVSRYGTEASIFYPVRSQCPNCKVPLAISENIPLVSFLIQKGHCKHCHTKISLFYPSLELISMVWSILAISGASSYAEWLLLLLIGGICIVASAIDLRTFILPDVLTYSGAIIVLAASYTGILHVDFRQALLGGFIGAFSMWAIAALYKLIRKRDGLGLGDVKFMLMLGAMTGIHQLSTFILIASICALLFTLITTKGSSNISTRYIPFGPFLAVGAGITYLYGEQITFFLRH